MGFQEWLGDIGSGVKDIFTAPVGLIYDTARAMTSSTYNPGFFGTFGGATEQLIGGLGKVGTAVGANWVGERVGESALGAPLREVLRQGELLYSSEFQRQEQDPGWIGGAFGAQPGTVSLQRAGATGTGLSGSLVGAAQQGLRGQFGGAGESFGDAFNVYKMWERAATRTPGQAWVEQSILPDFYTRTPEQQAEIRETAWYNLTTGSIDAVGRWFTDPGVIAGKSWKWSRSQYMTFHLDDAVPSGVARSTNHIDSVKSMGYELGEELEPIGGARVTALKSGRNDTLYAVVKKDELRKLREEGSTTIGDEIDLDAAPDNPRYAGTDFRPLTLHGADEIDEVKRYAAALHSKDPNSGVVILEIDADGLPVIYEDFDVPYFPDKAGVDPTQASFFTLTNIMDDASVRNVIDPPKADLDITEHLDTLAPSQFDEPGKFNPRMFDPDGNPIEPDQQIYMEDFTKTLQEVIELNGSDAEKYLIAKQRERNGGQALSESIVDNASKNRTFQSYLNWMDGRNADDIRRVLFPNNPFGGIISTFLADAKTYKERRSILLATMGHRDPGLDVVEPLVKARLEKLLEEQERISQGLPPNEKVQAMYGLQGRFNDIPPEQMGQVFTEVISEIKDQQRLTRFMDQISDMAPVHELRMPVTRRATNMARKTTFYQESPLARPLRSVVEWRPHQFIHVDDIHADIQIRRQMEEAKVLGVTAEETRQFSEAFNRANSAEEKIALMEKMHQRVVQGAADKAGMSKAEFQEALRVSHQGRQELSAILESRRYAPGGKDIVDTYDAQTGEAIQLTLPLLSTQTTGWQSMPNILELNRAASRLGRFKARHGYIAPELFTSFYQIWKPMVLLRGGWMLRVVSDEQLRILASTGSIIRHIAAIAKGDNIDFGIRNLAGAKQGQGHLTPGQYTANAFSVVTGTRPITAMSQRVAKATTAIGDKLGVLDEGYMKKISEVGIEDMVSARATRNGPNEAALHHLQALLGRDEFTILDHLYTKGTGQWMSIDRGDPMFGSAWTRVLKEQLGRDPLARKIAQEVEIWKTAEGLVDDVAIEKVYESTLKWLKTTKEGAEVSAKVPWMARNPEKWVDDVFETMHDYTAAFDDDIMEGMLNQRITPEMLNKVDERLRPDTVHAEIIDQATGNSAVTRFIKDFTSEAFDLLGRLPTDTLSRQPFFKQIYAREMIRLERAHSLQGLGLTEDALRRMDTSARHLAIRETKDLLYDMAETSRFGDMAKFVMPFYPAWQEVFKVWGKIAAEDPSVIARGRILWQAPDKAGMTYTDNEGNEFLHFRLSEQTSNALGLTGWTKYLAEGGIDFGKTSFNLILNNPLPGFTPLVQYPVNEVLKRKPEFAESVQFMLPYGVTADSLSLFTSPLMRQLQSELEGPQSDAAYVRAWVDAITWMDVEYRAGRRTDPPTEAEAHDIASKLRTIRLFTRLGAPAQPVFRSPLQPYIDIYRDMQDNLGPENAAETFLNEYGTEFFAVTLSRTVSATGIPPTVEAEVARREFTDLIEQYPEYGRLIIGDEALGEFSTGAFAAQLERPLDPDNPFSEMERTYRKTELDPRTGTIIEVDRRLGWQEYINVMDQIDLTRRKLGLPNLRVKGAEQLAQVKQMATEALAAKYPSWYEDFSTRDDLKWSERVAALTAVGNNPVAASRADIQGLNEYLSVRQAILQELNRRKMVGGSSTLGAIMNQDLAFVWDSAVVKILEDNIAFGPLYYRYLEGDPVELR